MLKPDGLTAKKSSLRSWFSRSKSREPSPHSSNTTDDGVISISQNAPPLEQQQTDALAVMAPGVLPPPQNPENQPAALVIRQTSIAPSSLSSIKQASTSIATSESSRPKHRPRENAYGLLSLHIPDPTYPYTSTSPEKIYPVDIVAIHGITGDAYSTWIDSSTSTFWLRDCLPKEFPGARIYSYGYPAKVFMTLGTGDFDTFARGLLGSLRNERDGPQYERRSIIFICHSMGGIIVKKALNIAVMEASEYSNIRTSVTSIFFLGTPHRGSAAADLGSVLASIANIPLLGSLRSSLIKSLKRNAPELQGITRDFRGQTSGNIKFYSFYEEQSTLLAMQIVDESSATLDAACESIIPMLGYNHQNMCRFPNETSEGYKTIIGPLRRAVKDATEKTIAEITTEDKPCLLSLSFQFMTDRLDEFKSAYPKTCHWILQHKAYLNWKSRYDRLLWIKGHPGTGKSTLMAYLYRSLRANERRNMCLNFFFHGNGTTLQKSPLGMFRSLLHQLYTQTLEARIIILRAFEEKKGYGDAGKEWEWRLNELRDLFSDALIAVTGFAEVTVLVDALDEAVDQALDEEGPTVAEELLDYFHLLNGRVVAQGGRVHICISCRHYPNVAVGNGLQIYVERENGGDLETFVREQLQSHVSDWDKEPLDARSALVVALVDKAAGQFLWARIRVPEVARSLDDGVHAFEEVHKLIEAESNKLSALYEKIITSKIEVSLRAQALQFMQWVCLAERPLSLEELRFAMACDEDRINHPHQDHCEESEGFINSDNRMGRLAKSLSGGLAEVRNYDHGSRVQLIHQTVKEFLWSGGFALLFMQFAPAPTLGLSNDEMIGNSENRISRSCINYLRFGALTKASSYWEQGDERAFCFVDYAAKYWTLHAERAERRGVTQENIVELFETAPKAFEGWIRIYEAIDLYSAKRPDPSSRLIHVASSANLQSTVRYLLKRGVAVDEKGYRDNTALHCAAKSGHEQLVRLLLDENAEIEARNMEGYTALERAARAGHEGVVQLLLQRGAEINKVGHSGTALQAAAMEGNPKLVKFLIKNGADVNVQGGCWGNALQAAAMQGNEAVVKLLIEEGADVNIDGGYFGSALQAIASADEDCDVLARFLLDQGADVNAQGGKYGTALQAAARYNKLGFARLLLDRNADVNASGGEYGGALQAAAYGGSGDLVHLLIEAGADANADGGFYGSVLQAAAVRGGDKVVRILLEHGANVNARSGWFGSPLQAAAWACNEVVVRLLLSLGADVNWECGAWGHALQAAVIGNASESLIILLLDHGAHVTARGWALQDAVYWGRTGLFYLLLDRGAKVNNPVYDSVVGPGRYGSILQMAAASVTADVTIVRTLLDRGAKVNAQGGFYGNALQAAVDCGHQEIVELLLQRGADIDIQEGTFQGLLDAAKGKKSITKLLLDQDMKLRPPGGPSCHIEETYQVAPD